MAARDNFHSRLVAFMKIALPLTALGMLSTLFLLSERFDPEENLPLTSIDLQQRAEDQGATNATFAGVTRTGDEVMVLTKHAKPSLEDPRVFLADAVMAEYRLPSGAEIDITSNHAKMSQKQNTAALSGDVLMTTSLGYTITTDLINTRFDDLYAESPGPVEGTAPAGELSAGRMILKHNNETGTSQILFTGGVKLLYEPELHED